ncbi:Myelin and lymphocyte protein [Labeo rohita]|uniref:Myelin and lymphocyte protein n=1 Tax=Labeo rohita TaxID=84645 RepID=A0ABQ8LUI0_LABRO|nr:Myelin and lymphocyte protein [Labeo rohita]
MSNQVCVCVSSSDTRSTSHSDKVHLHVFETTHTMASSVSMMPSGCKIFTTMPDILFIPEFVFGGLVWTLVASTKVDPANPQGWVMFVSLFCFLITTLWFIIFITGINQSSIWPGLWTLKRRARGSVTPLILLENSGSATMAAATQQMSSLPSGVRICSTIPDIFYLPELVFGGLVWILVASTHVTPPNPLGWVMFVSVFCFVITSLWLIIFICGAHKNSSAWATADFFYHLIAVIFYLSASVILAYITIGMKDITLLPQIPFKCSRLLPHCFTSSIASFLLCGGNPSNQTI